MLHAEPASPSAPPAQKGDIAERRVEHLKKELSLTDGQTAQMKEILAQERAALKTIRADQTLAKEAKKEQALTVNKQYREKINAILTPEQQKVYAAEAEKTKERIKSKKAEK